MIIVIQRLLGISFYFSIQNVFVGTSEWGPVVMTTVLESHWLLKFTVSVFQCNMLICLRLSLL